MKIIELTPYSAMERFPSHQEIIKKHFKNNQSFRTLCSDYRKCLKVLHYWNMSALQEAPRRREEYETLLHELESEFLLILKESRAL